MEMLDGTEVIRAMDAPEAVPEAEDMVGTGADAGTRVEAGDGLMVDAAGGEDGEGDWEEWDSGDWVAGTGVGNERTGAEALAEAGSEGDGVEALAEAGSEGAGAGAEAMDELA